MTAAARIWITRIKLRVAAATGEYLAEHEHEPLDLWFNPLVLTWSQMDELLRTGQVVEFDRYGRKRENLAPAPATATGQPLAH